MDILSYCICSCLVGFIIGMATAGRCFEIIDKAVEKAVGEYCVDFEWCAEHEDCGLFKPKQKQTNADRIRAMTDEELAEFIAYSTSCETCVVRKSGSDECHNTNCSTAWLDWLKQEADNDP